MIIYGLCFYLFALVTVGSGLMVISARNSVHAVLWLIVSFFSAAGLFVLLGAEFLAMALIIVYVGAVAVLFLFVVMMLNITFSEIKQTMIKNLPLCLLVAVIMILDLYVALKSSIPGDGPLKMIAPLLPISEFGTMTNTQALGMEIYTDYVLAFQIAGLILLVAMIGAIALTLRKRKNVNRQDAGVQFARRPKDAVKLVHVRSGVGLDGMDV